MAFHKGLLSSMTFVAAAVLLGTLSACASSGPPTLSDEQFDRLLTSDLVIAGDHWESGWTLTGMPPEKTPLFGILTAVHTESCLSWVESAQADSGGVSGATWVMRESEELPRIDVFAMRFSSPEAMEQLYHEAKDACSEADDFQLLAASVEDGVYTAVFHSSSYDFHVLGRGNVAVASFGALPEEAIVSQIDAMARS